MNDLDGLGLSSGASALVLACRSDPGEVASLARVPEFGSPPFQMVLQNLAERHGVSGLVLSTLDRAGLLAEKDYPALRLLRRQAAIWDLERDFVLGCLSARGIPVVLLKGAALRLSAYRDPVERAFVDLDLLVPDADVDAAIGALVEAGYRSQADWRTKLYREHHHHIALQKDMGFMVEVHWALEPKRSPFQLDPTAFRNAAISQRAGNGEAIQVPRPEHHVLHLATQNLEDGYCRLSRIVDVDRVIAHAGPRFDWDLLATEAVRMRVHPAVALSLRLAEVLLQTRLDLAVYRALRVPRSCRLHLGLLDPVSHLIEQRVLRRASLERLIFLWSIPDAPLRRQAIRATFRGEQDWFAELGFLQTESTTRRPPRWRVVPMLKLLAAQGWLYVGGSARRLSGRRRRFWTD